MKVGNLVRHITGSPASAGVITGFDRGFVIVFWGMGLPDEWEYPEQLEVISERR